jgi:Tol biopolymer transport system component
MIAYLEMVRNSERENSYQLFLQTLNTNHNLFLTDSLYRNEQNKISKANSTSYVWHPNGNYIFFITTNAKRNVAYVDLNNINNPKIRIMKTGVEFAEQLAISPNGKYLAVMTMIASETDDTDDTDALGQLLILELQL